jgi:hypothetical protein
MSGNVANGKVFMQHLLPDEVVVHFNMFSSGIIDGVLRPRQWHPYCHTRCVEELEEKLRVRGIASEASRVRQWSRLRNCILLLC